MTLHHVDRAYRRAERRVYLLILVVEAVLGTGFGILFFLDPAQTVSSALALLGLFTTCFMAVGIALYHILSLSRPGPE